MKKISLWVAFSAFLLSFAVQALADDDANRNILRNGLLGAGTGAIAASASGGKAGKGALIGAGTNVIGGALLDTLMPSQPKPQPVQYVQAPPQYVQAPPQYAPAPVEQPQAAAPKKHVIRKYDADGHIVSEEEVYE